MSDEKEKERSQQEEETQVDLDGIDPLTIRDTVEPPAKPPPKPWDKGNTTTSFV